MNVHHGAGWSVEGGLAIESVLGRPLLDKLGDELERYQDKDFLKAAMAVCALTACADDEILLAERCAITSALQREPAFHAFDVDKANQIINEYIAALQKDEESAKAILSTKVERMAGDRKKARTLMRIAHLIITADYDIDEAEMQEFHRLCALVEMDPHTVLGD